jgi:hypothetical protein
MEWAHQVKATGTKKGNYCMDHAGPRFVRIWVARDHARITAGTKTGSQKTNPTCYLFFLRSLFFHLPPLEPETSWIAQFVDQKLQAAKINRKRSRRGRTSRSTSTVLWKINSEKGKLQATILSLPTPDLVFPCRKTPVLQHQIMVLPDDLVPTV